MTTSELIESHLGTGWVRVTHDDTALLSLLDRIMGEFEYDITDAKGKVRIVVMRDHGELWSAWWDRLDELVARCVPVS